MALWIYIALSEYLADVVTTVYPASIALQVNCKSSLQEILTKNVTIYEEKIITTYECKNVQEKAPVKEIPVHCNDQECRSQSGNCNRNKCTWDSGYRLALDDFQPPKETGYTWEKDGVSHEKLMTYKKTEIPKIFHQSWKDIHVPDRYKDWETSCMDLHVDYDYLLWTDVDNRLLVAKEYPWLLYTYDRLRSGIQRADFVRYVYLHHFGGIYADLDVECLKNSDELIKNRIVVLGVLGDDYDFIHNIPNAILASKKGHPFWLFLLNRISMLLHQNDGTEATTGPIILRDAYRLFIKYEKYKNDFYVASPGELYGVDWHKPPKNCVAAFNQPLDAVQCKKLFPNAFMITYWTHSWS